jgi:hypothetical protein
MTYARLLAERPATRDRGLEWLEMYAAAVGTIPCCLRIPARQAIAEAYERAGEGPAAARHYQHVLRLLEGADPEHEPRREAVRAAMARLGAR